MRRITIEEAEADLEVLVDRIEAAGESFLIMRGGRPVAVMRPPSPQDATDTARAGFVWPTPRYPET